MPPRSNQAFFNGLLMDGVSWRLLETSSRVHRLTAYDAAYLELALRTGCPLASLDAELNASASGLGIVLFNG
jgi:predicted nucleic acid-binding protein